MKKRLFFLVSLLNLQAAFAQPAASTDVLQINKQQFKQGDTIRMLFRRPESIPSDKPCTVHIWLQSVTGKEISRFRYPLTEQDLNAEIIIGPNIPGGFYYLDYMIQDAFYQLVGQLDKASDQPKQIRYYLVTKGMRAISRLASVKNRQFVINQLLFPDSARICFSGLTKRTFLQLNLKAPLDSAFKPDYVTRQKIFIGKEPVQTEQLALKVSESLSYGKDVRFFSILPEVIVYAKSKRRSEKFEEENVSALFSAPDAISLDGLTDEAMSKATDLSQLLLTKIPGLRLDPDGDGAGFSFSWRGLPVTLFLNETKISEEELMGLMPNDLALIRAFRPGSFTTQESGNTGVIAIYTKTLQERNENARGSVCFNLVGYTQDQVIWQTTGR